MASNVTALINVYQIDQSVLPRDTPRRTSFPTTGCILQDVSGSPTRSLSSGYNVYGLIIFPNSGGVDTTGTKYYTAETVAQLLTIFNA